MKDGRNRWKNTQTGDIVTIKQVSNPARGGRRQFWTVRLNGEERRTLSRRANRPQAVSAAKNEMENFTRESIGERFLRNKAKRKAIRKFKEARSRRSPRAQAIDRTRQAESVTSLDMGSAKEISRWAEDPSRHDIQGVDTRAGFTMEPAELTRNLDAMTEHLDKNITEKRKKLF